MCFQVNFDLPYYSHITTPFSLNCFLYAAGLPVSQFIISQLSKNGPHVVPSSLRTFGNISAFDPRLRGY